MVTHFIKIAKVSAYTCSSSSGITVVLFLQRLNALQNFNSVMAIISGLKSAPIERLKKTWNLVSKRDINQFERIWHIMFDTSDNKRKLRDLHNHCKLPVIPFLGMDTLVTSCFLLSSLLAFLQVYT
jgi:RasGEF domain